jgi:hypothetical protein
VKECTHSKQGFLAGRNSFFVRVFRDVTECSSAEVDGCQLVLALFHHRKRNDAHGGLVESEVEEGVLDGSYKSANDCD